MWWPWNGHSYKGSRLLWKGFIVFSYHITGLGSKKVLDQTCWFGRIAFLCIIGFLFGGRTWTPGHFWCSMIFWCWGLFLKAVVLRGMTSVLNWSMMDKRSYDLMLLKIFLIWVAVWIWGEVIVDHTVHFWYNNMVESRSLSPSLSNHADSWDLYAPLLCTTSILMCCFLPNTFSG